MDGRPKHGASVRDSTGLPIETLCSHVMPAAQERTVRQVVLPGSSTPLVSEVFAEPPRRASLLSGMVVTDAEELLPAVAQDGDTRDFKSAAAKVDIWVSGTASGAPETQVRDGNNELRSIPQRRPQNAGATKNIKPRHEHKQVRDSRDDATVEGSGRRCVLVLGETDV
jgi:hypothetical protein